MSTDLIGLNFNSSSTLTSALASSSTTTVSSAASSTDSSATGSLGIQGDDKKFSKGAEMMQKLSDLQSSDPEKFKQVAQTISDKLTEAAKNSSDSKASAMYTKMAEKFSEAAKSGSMSSLTPPSHPGAAAGAQGQAAMKYAQNGGGSASNPMENLDSIISSALSGADSTSA